MAVFIHDEQTNVFSEVMVCNSCRTLYFTSDQLENLQARIDELRKTDWGDTKHGLNSFKGADKM